MASEVMELVAKIRPDGASETQGALDETTESFEETADIADTQSKRLEGFANKWQGAMTAIVGGLAVASAALLSQVPVVGGLMAGLESVIAGVAFQMDKVLRPALQPVVDWLFKLSEKVFNAEGAMGTLIGVGATLVSVVAIIAATVASAVGAFLALGGSWATVTAIAGTVVSALAGIASTILGLISLPALLIGAIIALAAALIFNVGGMRDKLIEFAKDIWNGMTTWFENLISDAVPLVKEFAGKVKTWFEQLYDDASNIFDNLISDAKNWGKSLIQKLIQGVKNKVSDLRGLLNQDLAGGLSISGVVESVGSAANAVSSGGESNSPGFSARRNESPAVYLDGRRVDQQTGRYTDDQTSRRGVD